MVEQYQEGVASRPARRQDISVNANAEMFGAGVARGLQSLAASGRDWAGALAERDELSNSNDRFNRERRYTEGLRDLWYNPETGYMLRTGVDAVGARDAYLEQAARLRDAHGSGLTGQQLNLYNRATQGVTDTASDRAIMHEGVELRNATNQARQSEAELHMNEALLAYQDPVSFQRHLSRAVNATREYAGLNGWTPEATALAEQSLVSGAFAGVVMRMADEGPRGTLAAQSFFEANRDMFNADDHAQLEGIMRPLVRWAMADIDIGGALEGRGEATGATANNSEITTRAINRAGRVVATAEQGNLPGNVSYGNAGAVRHEPLTATLAASIGAATAAIYGPGARVVVYSGGQADAETAARENLERVGTEAHDHGNAADIHVFDADGRQLTGDELAPLIQYWLASGHGGVGAEMSGGGLHLDEGGVRWWDYLDDGGSLSDGQRAAMEAGRAGQMPDGYQDPRTGTAAVIHNYFAAEFGTTEAQAMATADGAAMMQDIIGDEEARRRGMFGRTVAAQRRIIQGIVGDPAGPQDGVERPDFEAAERLIFDAYNDPNADPLLIAAMEDVLNGRRRAYDRVVGGERAVRWDSLYERGITTGNWQLSMEDRRAFGAEGVQAWDNMVQNVLAGAQHTDPMVYASLFDMAVNDPASFINVELRDMLQSNQLSNAAYGELLQLQKVMRTAGSPEAQDAAVQAALGGVDTDALMRNASADFQMYMGYNPTGTGLDKTQRQQWLRFQQAYIAEVVKMTKALGAEPSDLELMRLRANLFTLVELPGTGGLLSSDTVVPRFMADDTVAPGGDVQQIAVTIDDIPEGLRQMLVGHYPDAASMVRAVNEFNLVAAGQQTNIPLADVLVALEGQVEEVSGVAGGNPHARSTTVYKFTDAAGQAYDFSQTELVDLYNRTYTAGIKEAMDAIGVTPDMLQFLNARVLE